MMRYYVVKFKTQAGKTKYYKGNDLFTTKKAQANQFPTEAMAKVTADMYRKYDPKIEYVAEWSQWDMDHGLNKAKRRENPKPSNMNRTTRISSIAKKADVAFSLALKKQFGSRVHLGDVRYGQKAFNAETKKAAEKFHRAMDMLRKQWERTKNSTCYIQKKRESINA